MSGRLKIGIPILGGAGWQGGIQYAENLVRCLGKLPSEKRPETYFVYTEGCESDVALHDNFLPLFDGVLRLRTGGAPIAASIHRNIRDFSSQAELVQSLDYVFPVNSGRLNRVFSFELHEYANPKFGFWIPDFQHVFLPQFFDDSDRATRDQAFGLLSEHATHIIFSSKDAASHYQRIYPAAKARAEVVHFCSLVGPEQVTLNPEVIREKYLLPPLFLLCCNQFWVHKSHGTVLEALAILNSVGVPLTLACTGSIADYRKPEYFEKLREQARALGLTNSVKFLGSIPRNEQLALMRASAAVVQPSLFEGWSTVLEDCRALGKLVVASNIDVHLEQDLPGARYFAAGSNVDLAKKLSNCLPILRPGPDLAAEQTAREHVEARAVEFASTVCRLAASARTIQR